MAVAVRGLACGKRESSDNVASLPAALVRRGDRPSIKAPTAMSITAGARGIPR